MPRDNLRTQAEAAESWCPEVGSARLTDREVLLTGEVPTVVLPRCVGRRCMFWLWYDGPSETEQFGSAEEAALDDEAWVLDEEADDGLTYFRSRAEERLGYCGRVGPGVEN